MRQILFTRLCDPNIYAYFFDEFGDKVVLAKIRFCKSIDFTGFLEGLNEILI